MTSYRQQMSSNAHPQKRGALLGARYVSSDSLATIFVYAAKVLRDIKAFSETSKDFHHASVLAGPRWWLAAAGLYVPRRFFDDKPMFSDGEEEGNLDAKARTALSILRRSEVHTRLGSIAILRCTTHL